MSKVDVSQKRKQLEASGSKRGRRTGGMSTGELVFVGVGGIIGAGFFLGCGLPIHTAGPSVLIAFALAGLITAQTVGSLISVAVNHPSKGSFKKFSDIYLGNFLGYLQGWTYFITSILTIASESVAMAIFAGAWLPHLPKWLLAVTFALIILVINAFGVSNFGRIESVMSVVKMAALVGFIVFVLWVIFGLHSGSAARPTESSAFFANGFAGLAESMLVVVFAYAGIGVFATAASELRDPKRLDVAGLLTISLLTVLYILSITAILFVEPWQSLSTGQSPFVQALSHNGSMILANVFNGAILIASFSVMAGAVFSSTTILVELGGDKEAPKFVTHTMTKRQIHYGALVLTGILIIAVILLSNVLPANVYNFLISASSFFTFFNWFVMLLTFLAWRRTREKGSHVSKLAFGQPISTVVVMLLIIVMAGYAMRQHDQRLGFYACLVVTLALSLAYLFVRRQVNEHKPAR